jgi:cytidine deaminase
MTPIPAPLQKLYELAKRARENSYSPYSRLKVGAAIRTSDGKVFTGCNVENSSYGGTNCAERVAIQSAVAQHGKFQLAEVMVVTDASPPWPPCGMCRQVIAEFARGGNDDVLIHAANLAGEIKTARFAELFPDAFTPSHLTHSS